MLTELLPIFRELYLVYKEICYNIKRWILFSVSICFILLSEGVAILGAFAKLLRATTSFVMSFCPSVWMWQRVCGSNLQDCRNQMLRTNKTPAPCPDRKANCSTTPTKHRTWNSIWENTQTEQDDYVLGPECERNCRNLTTYWKLEQGDTLHIKP
jgi:hypothetical protein